MKHSSKRPDAAPSLETLLPKRGRKPRHAMTLLQQRFVLEFLACLDKHEAARRVSASISKPATEGCEAVVCSITARAFLRSPAVKAAVRDGIADRFAALSITADKVLAETALIAFGNLPEALEAIEWTDRETGETRTDGLMRLRKGKKFQKLVAEYEEKPGKDGVGIRVKGFDKVGALKLLSQQLGMIDAKGPKQAAPTVQVNVTNMAPVANPLDRMAEIMAGLAEVGAMPLRSVNPPKQLEEGGGE